MSDLDCVMTDIRCTDCVDLLKMQADNSVQLVVTSPPYEDARTYGELGFGLRGQEWVDWFAPIVREMVRVCDGLVAIVVEGKTRQFQWSATPALLMADLHRSGVCLRKPPIFHRVGVPGSGGKDWLRNDYEFIVCCTKGGKLPWSDNTACGKECKWPVGGRMSNRNRDGVRKNSRHRSENPDYTPEPKVEKFLSGDMPPGSKLHTKNNGSRMRVQCYTPPAKANPGNVIKCNVGGGRMGSSLAHENEAPFPESLVEFFVKSFCPPGGTVLDPFCGSGTTAAACIKNGRHFIGCDIRESQEDLTRRRIAEVFGGGEACVAGERN